jgi:hypothetical protein
LRTGEVIEFQSEEIERLQAEVARKLGYRWSTTGWSSTPCRSTTSPPLSAVRAFQSSGKTR